MFSFKSDFQDAPLELTEADVSTIFFAQPGDTPAPEPDPPFALRLSGEGSLRVSSCTFSPDSVSARHPLLGPMKIKRSGVVAHGADEIQTRGKSEE